MAAKKQQNLTIFYICNCISYGDSLYVQEEKEMNIIQIHNFCYKTLFKMFPVKELNLMRPSKYNTNCNWSFFPYQIIYET